MNLPFFIAQRLITQKDKSFSRLIIRIAIVAVSLSIAVMLIATSLVNGFQQQIKDKMFGLWGNIQISNYTDNRSYENEPFTLNDKWISEIKNLKGITHLQSFATKPGIIKTQKDIEGIVLKGVGADFDWQFIYSHLVSSNPIIYTDRLLPSPDKPALIATTDTLISKNIIISAYTAQRLNLKLNEECLLYFIDKTPRVRKLKITGIYKTGLEEFDKTFALVDIRQVQKLNNWKPNQVGGYEVFTETMNEADTLAVQINEQVLPEVLYAQSLTNLKPQIFDWLNLQNTNELVILIVMSIVAIINIITTLLILILERTRMIGLLKSLGMGNWQLRNVFLNYALFIIIRGLLWGNIIGLGICALQYFLHIIKLPEETYYLSYAPVSFDWRWIVVINISTAVLCLATLIIPSWLINKIQPVKAIRFE